MNKIPALALLVCLGSSLACAEESSGAPDAAAVYEEAGTSQMRVLYETGFEEATPPEMARYYAGKVPSEVIFSGVTDEIAHSGKHAYKMQVRFEPGRWGNAYFKLPIDIPQWSDVKARFHFKADSLPDTWFFSGFVGAQASAGVTGNNINGEKKDQDNGWEVWEVTAPRTRDIGDYVQGIGIRMQLPDHSPATTVTMYLDDVEITGKLPSNWRSKWAEIYQYITVDQERVQRESATRRLAGMKARVAGLEAAFGRAPLPATTGAALRKQYAALCERIESDFNRIAPMLSEIRKALSDTQTRFTAKINAPERIINDLSLYVAIARAYPAYARQFGDAGVITFTLDPTRSYAILPDGPQGHNEELSYYNWSGQGLENPQLLPNALPVPAAPSRKMTGCGCRDTFVPLSFALLPAETIERLTFDVSALRANAGEIPAAAVDIRYVATWWRPWNDNSTCKPRLMNEMLLHDPDFVRPVEGKEENAFKDARFGSDTAALQPLNIAAGTVRQFYVTVRVPGDAEAGLYKGTITAGAEGMKPLALDLELEVFPFDLEPTPFAYSFFYRTYPGDEEAVRNAASPFQVRKTPAQMEADLVGMAAHGVNTLNLYAGTPTKTDDGWDFSALAEFLAMAKRAGLARSPFTWLAHGQSFLPMPERPHYPKTMDEVIADFKEFLPAVNAFCDENGYPRPALFGHDEASGERLRILRSGYGAVNAAGGTVTVACYPSYFDEIGDALSLPIVYGGAQTAQGRTNIHASRKLGYECWIYNCPATNLSASPSVYRRRYGLAMWRNGEQGAAPWEYQGMPRQRAGEPPFGFNNVFTEPLYCVAMPTWNGPPVDTIIYEAFREGVYDTRYMATLEAAMAGARRTNADSKLVTEIETWLAHFSVNDDLARVRRQMAGHIVALLQETEAD